jgi:hypothetical protein
VKHLRQRLGLPFGGLGVGEVRQAVVDRVEQREVGDKSMPS